MNRWLLLIWGLGLTLTAWGQYPDLSQAVDVWQGQVGGRDVRVWQIPRQTTALIPLRFGLMEVNRPAGAASLLDEFDYAEIVATGGAEARLSYSPNRQRLFLWGDEIAETRETFRAPGQYRVTFGSETHPDWVVHVPIEVRGFQYLGFGEEFGLFVVGCLVLGLILLGIIVWLHRRTSGGLPPSPS